MKLFLNFTSIPFDYLLITWVANYVSNREFFNMFILDRIDRDLHPLKCLDRKFGSSSEFSKFFNKIPVRIPLDVLFRVFRFSKASCLCPDIFIHRILKLRRHLGIET